MRALASLIIRIQYVYIFFFIIATGNFLTIKTTQAFWWSSMRTIHRAERIDLTASTPNAHASPNEIGFVNFLFNFDVQVDFRIGYPTVLMFVFLHFGWDGECVYPLDSMKPNLVICRIVLRDKTFHIRKRIAPFTCHNQDSVLMKFGSDKWIHLGHVAAEPEQPAGGRGQYKDALHDSSVGSLRSDDWQNDANHAENRRENNNW